MLAMLHGLPDDSQAFAKVESYRSSWVDTIGICPSSWFRLGAVRLCLGRASPAPTDGVEYCWASAGLSGGLVSGCQLGSGLLPGLGLGLRPV